MIHYTGIGSRNCPQEVLDAMFRLGAWLSNKGIILRSGGANGADSAFEHGCDSVNGAKEIYLPWRGFNESKSNLIVKNKKAFELAKKYHPYFDNLKDSTKNLMARNSHQVLGENLNMPSAFIVCYTPGGKSGGGTGQAIRIAKAYGIPVFDFGAYQDMAEARKNFIEFYNNIVNS